MTRRGRELLVLLVVGALLAACGGAASPTVAPTAAAKPAGAGTAGPTTTPAPTAATAAIKPAAATPAAATPRVTGALTVFAAASLTEAFTELGKEIEAANPGTTITFNFAGSRALRTHLREGARADVFVAADEPTMQGARQDGTIGGEPRVFVQNKLVAIVAQPGADEVAALQDLARPGLKLVLAQEAVPVGNYSRQALTRMAADASFGADFAQKTLANVVSLEANVRQVVTKVQLGEADAGIVYSSDVTPAVRPLVKVLEIPDPFNVIARYPIAPVQGAANTAGATAFIDHVLSPAGQAVLQRWGFIPVGPTGAVADGEAGSAHPTGTIGRAGPPPVAALRRWPAETVQAAFLSGQGERRPTDADARLHASPAQATGEAARGARVTARADVVVSSVVGAEAVIARGRLDSLLGSAASPLVYQGDGAAWAGADGSPRLAVVSHASGGRHGSGAIEGEGHAPAAPPGREAVIERRSPVV